MTIEEKTYIWKVEKKDERLVSKGVTVNEAKIRQTSTTGW